MAKIDAMAIINHYKSLDDGGKAEYREKALAITGWALPTFYYKMRKGNIKKTEILALAKITPSQPQP